jgi:NOL1/NOP2/sun family putative RNA methylase
MTSPINLPADFLARMARLLGDEFPAFVDNYRRLSHAGLRVNTFKVNPSDFRSKAPFGLDPVGAWEPAGFRVVDDSRPGAHPYHAAGLYYLQEPSAMTVVAAMDPQPGETVLDLAAAPGGKATHVSARMGDTGLLVANDTHTGRARILSENLERWGTRHALIINTEPKRLAALWGPVFDRVLVDAPCSGEGMFRRTGGHDWSEEMVISCAVRQRHILDTAASLVRPGGRLVYATCTFSPEENEAVIARFLIRHEEFELVEVEKAADWDSGRNDWLPPDAATVDVSRTVRLWPHRFGGEGHFIAVMQRRGGTLVSLPLTSLLPLPTHSDYRLWQEFAAQAELNMGLAREEMSVVNGRLYRLPPLQFSTAGLHILRAGLLLGELRRGHFRPAHHLALALRPREWGSITSRPTDHPDIAAYLLGHDLPDTGSNGWVLFAVDGFILGWGKRVNGRLKNHYPRSLRR